MDKVFNIVACIKDPAKKNVVLLTSSPQSNKQPKYIYQSLKK
jgi:hypothetical protein